MSPQPRLTHPPTHPPTYTQTVTQTVSRASSNSRGTPPPEGGGASADASAGGSGEPVRVLTFDEMGLPEPLLKGIYSYGFERPSPVQQLSIVPVSRGRDAIVQAQSGTGKTGAFGIALLARLDASPAAASRPQGLVLAPTRELADQSYRVLMGLGDAMGVRVMKLVGGTPRGEDVAILRAGVHVVVGTPGRVYDMISRGALQMGGLRALVVDEADEMLTLGFKDQLVEIFGAGLPVDAQVALYSATMPPEALELTARFMRNPLRVLVPAEQLKLDGIRQFRVDLADDALKPEVLADIYAVLSVSQCIIFANTRARVEQLAAYLRTEKHTVDVVHSELPQEERNRVVAAFKAGSSRVLVASGVLSRGIDVQGLSLVVNFDVPREREEYLHRVGRVGRYGRKGVAINLVTPRDAAFMRDIEQHFALDVQPLPDDLAALAGGP